MKYRKIFGMYMNLEKKDLELLKELQKDSSQSLKKLSRKLKIPITTIYDKKKKFEKEGIIKNYRAILDPDMLGKTVLSFIFLKVRYDADNNKSISLKDIAREVSLIPGVMAVHIVTGEWDLLIKMRSKDMKEVGDILTDHIIKIKGISGSLTLNTWITIKDTCELDI